MRQPVYFKSFEYSMPVSEEGFHHIRIDMMMYSLSPNAEFN